MEGRGDDGRVLSGELTRGRTARAPDGQSFARRTKHLAVALGLPALLALPTTLIVSRALGPADKGAWSVIIQYLFLLEQVSSLGGGAYLAVRVAQGEPVGRLRRVTLGEPVVVPLVATLVLFAAGFSSWLPDVELGLSVVLYFAVALPALVLGRHLMHVLIGLHRMQEVVRAQAAQSVSLLAGIALFAALDWLTLTTALWIFLSSVVVRAAVPLFALRSVGLLSRKTVPVPLRDFLGFGTRRMVTDVEDSINTRLPMLLVAAVEPLSVTGVYSVAIGLMEVLAHGGTAISMAMLSEGTPTSNRRADLVRLSVLCGVCIALGGTAVAFAIPIAFGSAFAGAVPALLWLLPAVPLLTLGRALASQFATANRTGVAAVAGIMSLAGIIAGVVVLAPHLGTTGASVGLIVGLALQSAYLLRCASRDTGLPVSDFVVLQHGDVRRVVHAVRQGAGWR